EPTGLLIAAIRRRIKQVVIERVGPLGLSAAQFWLLVAVQEHDGYSQRELASRLHMDEPTASRVLAVLSREGWVKLSEDARDRRRVRVGLTATGRAMAKKLMPIALEVRATVDSKLEPGERDTLRALQRQVIDRI